MVDIAREGAAGGGVTDDVFVDPSWVFVSECLSKCVACLCVFDEVSLGVCAVGSTYAHM